MESFSSYCNISINEEVFETEYQQFVEYVEQDIIREFSLPAVLKSKIDFIKDLADKTMMNMVELFKIFKDKKVFKFMSYFGWSINKLFAFVRKGFKEYHAFMDIVAKKISESKAGMKWEELVIYLEDLLKTHPKLKKIGGVAVASILAYIWFNMTFTGSAEYDFNMGDMLTALAGSYSLSALFAGDKGIKLLVFLVTGKLGLSFPWPGAQVVQFTAAVILTLGLMAGVKVQNHINLLKSS